MVTMYREPSEYAWWEVVGFAILFNLGILVVAIVLSALQL